MKGAVSADESGSPRRIATGFGASRVDAGKMTLALTGAGAFRDVQYVGAAGAVRRVL